MGKLTPAEVVEVVKLQEPKFTSLNKSNGSILDFEQECLFARQQILKNNFTLQIAASNPNSLRSAILNVAAIGLSLNPATQHAYLVPRDGGICLDISYQGLRKLATDSGSIKWAKCELVYENDHFKWCGPASVPTHEADPFGDRGACKGGYCVAKLPDGEYLTEVMCIDDIHKIRDTSKAFKKGGGPWVDWPDEMAKKTILKRAYKQWPQTPNRRRIDDAVSILNETEGTAYSIEQHTEYMASLQSQDELALWLFTRKTPEHVILALYNSFDKGQKSANKKLHADLEKAGLKRAYEIADDLIACIDCDDANGVLEITNELGDDAQYIIELMSTEHAQKLQSMNIGDAA